MRESSGLLVVEENEVVGEHLVPKTQSDVFRKVVVMPGGLIKGSIVAGSVELHSGSRVEGSVLAGEVMVIYNGAGGRVEVNGDVVSLSRVTVSATPNTLENVVEPVFIVKGDVIAKREASLPTSLVCGNVLSERVELANSVILGVLGLIRFGEVAQNSSASLFASKVRNSIVFTLLSELSMEVSGVLGVIAPLVYVKQDALIGGDGEIVLVDSADLLKYVVNVLLHPGRGFEPVSSFISRYVAEHRLARIPVSACKGVVSMVELERLPAIKGKRKESVDELIFKLAERLYYS